MGTPLNGMLRPGKKHARASWPDMNHFRNLAMNDGFLTYENLDHEVKRLVM